MYPQVAPVPYYNPDHPNALVLPRPPSSHQVIVTFKEYITLERERETLNIIALTE